MLQLLQCTTRSIVCFVVLCFLLCQNSSCGIIDSEVEVDQTTSQCKQFFPRFLPLLNCCGLCEYLELMISQNLFFVLQIYTLGVSPSLVSRWREAYSFGVFEDLKFKISEGSDQNW